MPRMARLVVCGFALVIAIFSPTNAFVSVDFPTLGRPTKVTNPLRVVSVIVRLLFLACGAFHEHCRDPSSAPSGGATRENQTVDLRGDARLRNLVNRLTEQSTDRIDVLVFELDAEEIADVVEG